MSAAGNADVTPARVVWDRPVLVAAYFSLTAGVAHLWATPEHQAVWWGYGAFFIAVGLAQALFGFLLLRRLHPVVLAAGIWGNVGIILLYVVTRTSGIPIGPHATVIEDPGLFDMTTTVMELGLVFILVSMLSNAHRTWTMNALVVVGAAFWGLRFIEYIP